MSAPFQSGDVVVCVDDAPCVCCGMHFPLLYGRTYRVTAIGFGVNPRLNKPIHTVGLHGVPASEGIHAGWGYNADRFRKIDGEVTEEFRQALRTLKTPETADA